MIDYLEPISVDWSNPNCIVCVSFIVMHVYLDIDMAPDFMLKLWPFMALEDPVSSGGFKDVKCHWHIENNFQIKAELL